MKNTNNNRVAEKAFQEVGDEILKLQPRVEPILEPVLAKANALIKSRLCCNVLLSKDGHKGTRLLEGSIYLTNS